jgi:tetratricopeptide (TPR) repeat protein
MQANTGRDESQQVPINKILDIEFDAHRAAGIECPEKEVSRRAYEKFVADILERAKVRLAGRDIKEVNERELFECLSTVLYEDMEAFYKKGKMLATAVLGNEFDCDVSSALQTGVVTSAGRKISIMRAPGHEFLAGDEYAFETTLKSNATLPKAELHLRYPYCHELSVEKGLLFGAHYRAGKMLFDAGKYAEARMAFQSAIELNPENSDAWNGKGIAFKEMGRYGEALEALNRAIELYPENKDAWNNKGAVLTEIGRYGEALGALERAMELDPNWATPRYNKGILFLRGDSLGEALRAFEEVIGLDPECEDAWHNKGAVLRKMGGDQEEIDACFRKAEELKNKSDHALVGLCRSK